jgi:hypothetical protein
MTPPLRMAKKVRVPQTNTFETPAEAHKPQLVPRVSTRTRPIAVSPAKR